MTDAEREVIRAARHWWAMRRPLAWDEAEHLANPAVNSQTDADHALAHAVAGLSNAEQGEG